MNHSSKVGSTTCLCKFVSSTWRSWRSFLPLPITKAILHANAKVGISSPSMFDVKVGIRARRSSVVDAKRHSYLETYTANHRVNRRRSHWIKLLHRCHATEVVDVSHLLHCQPGHMGEALWRETAHPRASHGSAAMTTPQTLPSTSVRPIWSFPRTLQVRHQI